MASTRGGGKRPVEAHYEVIRFRQNLQRHYCRSRGMEPLVPGDGTCSRCDMNVWSYTPPNAAEYFGNHLIKACPWCGRDLSLAQADEIRGLQLRFADGIDHRKGVEFFSDE